MMFEKINISSIIKDHLATLIDLNKERPGAGDYIVFLLIPMALATGLAAFAVLLSKEMINVLITSFSVFAALLFNLLLLIYDIMRRAGDPGEVDEVKTRFLKHIYSNISFCILVSISVVIVLLVPFLDILFPRIQLVVSWVVYLLVSNFMLTLFMILTRVHTLLSMEFQPRATSTSAEGSALASAPDTVPETSGTLEDGSDRLPEP